MTIISKFPQKDAMTSLRLEFLGAVKEVTGSRTLLQSYKSNIYIDVGMYQGNSHLEKRNHNEFEIPAQELDYVLLTHAHLDHSGLLPKLVKEGFKGQIFCTKATYDLLSLVLYDSAYLFEKRIRSQKCLYTVQDVDDTLKKVKIIHYNTWTIINDVSFFFKWSGHILGSAYLYIKYMSKIFCFSGDIAPKQSVLHKKAKEVFKDVDYVIMESTYGNKIRKANNYQLKITALIKEIIINKGVLLIPAFAIGRTQTILYVLYQLQKEQQIPQIPIYLDSPMAIQATQYYMNYPEYFKEDINVNNFFNFLNSYVNMVTSVETSKELMQKKGPLILISASGMCHGGRVMHHLKSRIQYTNNILLFIGYQAKGTLGNQLLEGASRVKIYEHEYLVKAKVYYLDSFSSHADQRELKAWLASFNLNRLKKIFINHGTQEARENLKDYLQSFNKKIELPNYKDVFYV